VFRDLSSKPEDGRGPYRREWEIPEPLIPDPPRRADGKGRPWRDPRDVLNAILWILRTGAPWRDLPERNTL
jgi:transposase